MSKGRDLYLQRINNNTKSPEEFVAALIKSPYPTHRQNGLALVKELENMKQAIVSETERRKESSEFAKTIMS